MTTKTKERQREAMLRELNPVLGSGKNLPPEEEWGHHPDDPPIGSFNAAFLIRYRGFMAWDHEGRCVQVLQGYETQEPGGNCFRLMPKDLPGRVAQHQHTPNEGLLSVWLEDGRCFITDLSVPMMPFLRRQANDLSLQQAEKNLIEMQAIRDRQVLQAERAKKEHAERLKEAARVAELEATNEALAAAEAEKAAQARLEHLESLKP